MRTHPAQVLRSYYIFFMQLPWLPEFLFKAANFRAMTAALTRTSRPGTFSEQDFEHYREASSQTLAGAGAVRVNDRLKELPHLNSCQ